MTANSNALLRHKTIDACLRDTQNKYTLIDLINACSRALKEKNGKNSKNKSKVSVRTVQLDIQFMVPLSRFMIKSFIDIKTDHIALIKLA